MAQAEPASNGHDRLVFDCLSALLLLAVAIFGAYLPKYLASRGSLQQGTASSLAFHLGNMLSGGVMLSAGFCHLLADALRQLAFIGRFPIAPFLAAVGYLTTLLADQLVQALTTDTDTQDAPNNKDAPSQLPSPSDGYYGGSNNGFYYNRRGGVSSAEPGPAAAGGGRDGGSGGTGFSLQQLYNPAGRAWGYTRLVDKQQQQLDAASLDCQAVAATADGGGHGANNSGGAIELMQQQGGPPLAARQAGAAAAASASAAATPGPCSTGSSPHPHHPHHHLLQLQLQQQQPRHVCACCCHQRHPCGGSGGVNGPSPVMPQHPPAAPSGGGFARRPGSAGGVARAGSGLGCIARTRSLTGPAASGTLLGGAAATAAGTAAAGGAAGALEEEPPLCVRASASPRAVSAAGLRPRSPRAAKAAAGQQQQQQQQQQQVWEGLGSGATAAAAAGGQEGGSLGPSLQAGGVSGGSCSSNSGGMQDQAGTNDQQQQQQQRSQQGCCHPGSLASKQQQQQQHGAAASNGCAEGGPQDAGGDDMQPLLLLPAWQQQQQLVRAGSAASPGLARQHSSASSHQHLLSQQQQQQQQSCCCCCWGAGAGAAAAGGYACGSARACGGAASAQPDMTEACTVARVAGHLELEVMSTTTTGGHNHAHFQVFLSHRPLSFATSLLLACALCIHSILEGLALGAQQSMQATEDIMLAIAAHKGLAAYALGASIVESKASDSKFWLVVGLFAAATPLGIGIGYASSVLGHGPVSAAMSALASGTFLYVALNEVIPKELEHPDGHRLAKVAALLLGFGLMSLLAVWA